MNRVCRLWAQKEEALVELTPTQTSAYVILGAGSPNHPILRQEQLQVRVLNILKARLGVAAGGSKTEGSAGDVDEP